MFRKSAERNGEITAEGLRYYLSKHVRQGIHWNDIPPLPLTFGSLPPDVLSLVPPLLLRHAAHNKLFVRVQGLTAGATAKEEGSGGRVGTILHTTIFVVFLAKWECVMRRGCSPHAPPHHQNTVPLSTLHSCHRYRYDSYVEVVF